MNWNPQQSSFMSNYGVGQGNILPGGMPWLQDSPNFSLSGGLNIGSPGTTGQGGSIWDKMKMWSQGSDGPGGTSKLGEIFGSEGFQNGMSGFSALADMYTGFKALGLAKDQLQFQKKTWNKNYDAQRKDYENNLKDRWAARNASAATRGQTFEGMNSWVDKRNIDPRNGG